MKRNENDQNIQNMQNHFNSGEKRRVTQMSNR